MRTRFCILINTGTVGASAFNPKQITPGISIQRFVGLKDSSRNQAVTWGNYLTPIPKLRKNAKTLMMVVHQNAVAAPPPSGFDTSQAEQGLDWLYSHVANLQTEPPDRKKIVNLDLDFFCLEHDKGTDTVFRDDFITNLIEYIDSRVPDAIWAIAWSPSACGGWDEAMRLNELVCNALRLSFPTDHVLARVI